MPEGDTLFRIAARLRPLILGERALEFSVCEGRFGFRGRQGWGRPRAVPAALQGRRIESVRSVGKHLIVGLEGVDLLVHLGMSGSVHRYAPGEPWRRPDASARVVLRTASHVVVCFQPSEVTLGRAGTRLADLGPDLIPREPDGIAASGCSTSNGPPDPISASDVPPDPIPASDGPLGDPGPDLHEIVRRARSRGRAPIADVLLDQRVAAGVGNVYRSEALFLAGLYPWTPTSDLPPAGLRDLYATCRDLLARNLGAGPRTTTSGGAGGRYFVYGRTRKPCRRCGAPIRADRRPPSIRTVWWCPQCQRPGVQPTAPVDPAGAR